MHAEDLLILLFSCSRADLSSHSRNRRRCRSFDLRSGRRQQPQDRARNFFFFRIKNEKRRFFSDGFYRSVVRFPVKLFRSTLTICSVDALFIQRAACCDLCARTHTRPLRHHFHPVRSDDDVHAFLSPNEKRKILNRSDIGTTLAHPIISRR